MFIKIPFKCIQYIVCMVNERASTAKGIKKVNPTGTHADAVNESLPCGTVALSNLPRPPTACE